MSDTPTLPLPEYDAHMISKLQTRRSNLAKVMSAPGPDSETLTTLLDIAARVPDHRKLTPWRFIVFQGESRKTLGQQIAVSFKREYPDMPDDRVEFEASRLERAPVVVAVVSSPKDCPRGTPKWEQELSAGAVCFNFLLAAQAHGFAAQWLSEWFAYDADVLEVMGLSGAERIAGFIYLGSTNEPPCPRARPDVASLTHYA